MASFGLSGCQRKLTNRCVLCVYAIFIFLFIYLCIYVFIYLFC